MPSASEGLGRSDIRRLPKKVVPAFVDHAEEYLAAFVALGVKHALANMGYFAAGLIHGDVGTTWARRSPGTSRRRASAT